MRQAFLEVLDVGSGGRVVTVIEFLCAANKVPGEGQTLYLQKRREPQDGAVNLVEIDLTRAGRRILTVPPERIPPSHRTTYQICVWRASKPRQIEVYPAPLAARLPTIAVPLRESDDDVPLELQVLIERCYSHGRYDDLDCGSPPSPPLTGADEAWSDELLRSAGLRR
jgi:hypothetical protein